MLMYLFNSHAGRNTTDHYIVHCRLNMFLLSDLMTGNILTTWNRHYTDYSLVLKTDFNFKNHSDHYQFSVIKFHRNFIDYKTVRVSSSYVNDGSLYFDFTTDIPDTVLDVFCTDITLAHYRVNLFTRVIANNKNYLIANGYYSETGVFLREHDLRPLEDSTRDPTASTTTGTTVTGNTYCTINVNPTINYHRGAW